jgi:hypothetical protein
MGIKGNLIWISENFDGGVKSNETHQDLKRSLVQ